MLVEVMSMGSLRLTAGGATSPVVVAFFSLLLVP